MNTLKKIVVFLRLRSKCCYAKTRFRQGWDYRTDGQYCTKVAFYKQLGFTLIDIKSSVFRVEESMNTKHVPSLELCQEFDRLCKEKGIVVPETEFVWMNQPIYDHMGRHHGASAFQIVYTSERELFGCNNERLPAPLVSEQGEILHKIFIKMKEERIVITDPRGKWSKIVKAVNIMKDEANARQKQINYSIAEGIITKL